MAITKKTTTKKEKTEKRKEKTEKKETKKTKKTAEKKVQDKKKIEKKEVKVKKKEVKVEKKEVKVEKKEVEVEKKKEAKKEDKPFISSEKKAQSKPVRYFEAVGRRKTSVARVRLFTQGEKLLFVNEKPYKEYFSTFELQQIAIASLERMKCLDHFRVSVKVRGGGIHSQAEAVRHGISRALVKFNPDFRKRLRRAGYITRDPRARERKKFGLKRARRAPQWSKR